MDSIPILKDDWPTIGEELSKNYGWMKNMLFHVENAGTYVRHATDSLTDTRRDSLERVLICPISVIDLVRKCVVSVEVVLRIKVETSVSLQTFMAPEYNQQLQINL